MIRRLKSDVLSELPAKRRQRITVQCDQHCLKKINYMLKNVKKWDDKTSGKGEGDFLGALSDDFDRLQ